MKQKLRIMKSRPQITEEEIRSYMNFDSIVANRNLIISQRYKRIAFIATIVVIVGLIGIAYFLFPNHSLLPNVSSPHRIADSTLQSPWPLESISNGQPVIKEKEEFKKEIQPLKKSQALPNPAEDVDQKASESKYEYVEAQPINGYPNLYEYFNRELRYPADALRDSIEGIVTVYFIINKEGKPNQISVENSLGEPFDKEALRLIQNMPDWKPATVNGKPVSSRISVPLTFQILNTKNIKQ